MSEDYGSKMWFLKRIGESGPDRALFNFAFMALRIQSMSIESRDDMYANLTSALKTYYTWYSDHSLSNEDIKLLLSDGQL